MFAIRKVEISDKQHKVLNICLSDTNLKKLSSCNYTTLILGENGVGKSFLLKSIIDIFCFLESAQDSNRKRKPRYQYESFASSTSWVMIHISSTEYPALKL